jgi:carbon-monoxide dehydrogenase small subunit
MMKVAFHINGKPVEAEVEPRTSLADFLRNEQGLTATHLGCEHGVCGACTVVVDGVPARSCIGFAVALDGAQVRTVEGFDNDAVMARLREAFQKEHALQCGFCTPGMLVTARDIVTRFAEADEKRIRVELAGNLCRCTGYQGIVNAIQRVMREMPAEARLEVARARNGKACASPAARAPFRPFVAKADAGRAERSPATGAPADESGLEKGWNRICDSFEVPRPRGEVWALFGDIPRVTRCMPGAEFEAQDGKELKGRMALAFGPIKAAFACTMTMERDEADWTGVINGAGGDERGGSRAKGKVVYRLTDQAGAATRVDITMDYQLQGPLAQFGRSGLVKEFAALLTAQFARNLSASLGGQPDGRMQSTLSAGLAFAAFWRAFKVRLKAALGLK